MLITKKDGSTKHVKVGDAVRGIRIASIKLYQEDISALLNMHEEDTTKYLILLSSCMLSFAPVEER